MLMDELVPQPPTAMRSAARKSCCRSSVAMFLADRAIIILCPLPCPPCMRDLPSTSSVPSKRNCTTSQPPPALCATARPASHGSPPSYSVPSSTSLAARAQATLNAARSSSSHTSPTTSAPPPSRTPFSGHSSSSTHASPRRTSARRCTARANRLCRSLYRSTAPYGGEQGRTRT